MNTITAAEINIKTLTEEAYEATNLEDFASDQENSAAEKNLVVAKGEATKASKTDTNLEKFDYDQCNYKNSSQKRLARHVRMKHCFSPDIRGFRHDNVDICCDVIAVRFINQKP